MSKLQLLLGHLGTALLFATVVGMAVRPRVRLWYSFALYLIVNVTHSVLMSLWPDTYHRRDVWVGKEIALLLLRLAMVVEFTARVFRHFPGAMATARRIIVAILGVTFTLALATPAGEYQGFVGELMPRLINGTIWLFTSLAILILWYRLPVHWFPKAILLSYVPYMLVFTVALNALGDLGWQRAAWADWSSRWAYLLLLMYWTYTAWRRDPTPQRLRGDRTPLAS